MGGTLALESFKRQFGLADKSTAEFNTLSSNIVITFQAGCLFACLLSLPCAEILGRRLTLIIPSILFLVGAAIELTGNIGTLYAGRLLTGLGLGPLTMVASLYVSEIAPAAFRGRCIGFFEIQIQLGALLGFWINYGVSLHISSLTATQWRVPISLQLPLISGLLIGSLFLPESPRFLLKKDNIEEAVATLARLRNLDATHPFIQQEVNDIRTEIQLERASSGIDVDSSHWTSIKAKLHECTRRDILHRISVGVMCQLIAQLSGINGMNYYSPLIFESLGVAGTSTSLFATGIYGVVKSASATLSMLLLVDRLGRRTLLLISSAIMIFSLFFVGAYVKIAHPGTDTENIRGGAIAAIAFIYIYAIGYALAFGGVPYMLSSETVPINVRAISATLGASMQWLMNLVITKATPYMISSIGYGTFFFFGSCVVCGAIYIFLFVPETKGVPLEHMAAAFGYEDAVAIQEKMVQIKGTEEKNFQVDEAEEV
jgi:sugar porter (SP) family MFS transporter